MKEESFELLLVVWAVLLLLIGFLGGIGLMYVAGSEEVCEERVVFVSEPVGFRHDPLYVVKGVDGLAFKN